jgi:hypothetical protein
MVFWDSLEKFVGFLESLWYLGKLVMYSTRSVIIFSAMKELSDPYGPPFFSFKGCGLNSRL